MEEFIFPGEMIKCEECGQENGFFVEVSSKGEAFMFGSFCSHSKINVSRHKITRQEAAFFIRAEKENATDPEFIGRANRALLLLLGAKYQKRAA